MKRMTTLVLSLSSFAVFGAGLVEYPAGRNHALIVGVSHGLPGITIDLNNLDKIAKNKAYNYSVTRLAESQGTRANVKAKLGELAKLTQSDGTLLFYFSGHGNVGNISLQDGLLNVKDIRKAMEDARAEMGPMARLVIIVDSCHSGSLLDPFRKGLSDEQMTQLFVEEIQKEFEPGMRAGYWQNLFVFASSRANETSLAGKDGSEFTNAFTQAFNEGMSSKFLLSQLVAKSKQYTQGHHPVERFAPGSLASEVLFEE